MSTAKRSLKELVDLVNMRLTGTLCIPLFRHRWTYTDVLTMYIYKSTDEASELSSMKPWWNVTSTSNDYIVLRHPDHAAEILVVSNFSSEISVDPSGKESVLSSTLTIVYNSIAYTIRRVGLQREIRNLDIDAILRNFSLRPIRGDNQKKILNRIMSAAKRE